MVNTPQQKLKAFIIYNTYRIVENKAYIHLYGRLENGESFQTVTHTRPYFFIRTEDQAKAKELLEQVSELPVVNGNSWDMEETDYHNFDEEPMTKITLWVPGDVKKIRTLLEQRQIKCYEADIRFTTRFMIDHSIKGACKISGNYEKGDPGFAQRIYHEPTFTPLTEEEKQTFQPDLKILSVDIETNLNATKLFCISLVCKDLKKVIMITDQQLEGVLSVKDEKTLLEQFVQHVNQLDPDLIVGWNFIDFDLAILRKLFRKHKIKMILGRSIDEAKITIQSSFFIDSRADIVGRQVLDGIHLLKGAFIKMENYKLNTVAKKFLGKEKLLIGEARHEEIQKLYEQDQKKLAAYNLLDSELVYDLMHATGVLPLAIQRSLLTGMSLDRVNASIASLDFVYLTETRKKGLVVQVAKGTDREERIKGGFVHDSKPGIYKNILVLDFKSLYPSIIRTFNIDPYSFVNKNSRRYNNMSWEQKKSLIKSPNHALFLNDEGILPQLLEKLWQMRDKAKKEKNIYASNAIKLLMNSFFGVLANPNCRFYNLEMANAITHFGQYIIKLTSHKIQEMGYKVIYGDTDSIFVDPETEDPNKAKALAQEIQKKINKFYTSMVEKEYQRKSYLELEFEKTYMKFLLPYVRGSEKGAKKRYAGIILKDGKEVLQFVGLEVVRRDWTALAKKFQTELLEKIFHEKDVTGYIKQFIKDVKAGEYDDLLIYRKALRKDVREYTKTTPPHVKAARKLDKIEGNVIEYYITEEGPEPIQKHKSKIDYNHYIEKQLKPLADSILVFYDSSFDDLVTGDKQKSLFSY